ncbi:Nif3-like dinuclear metal center hexameric protein [Breznakiella homolactica]|uniref:Nif3-like dinuclear metal center hexameric protein n=1 Tax=Breznakiella homolactica TaxID=2798577 RepID=A0A7T8BCG5_9SPIR|nr:Nif3-like dinuclear metal center hexameric protein [Breznakiella homolactica]QQO10233.1 Nif3-like dinuclear metal center hexameric protein [Breznakiella homolactica]
MTSRTLDTYFRSLLDIDGFSSLDSSLNGLQVDNDGSEITKIAFAVDANTETFRRAADARAGMLFVHHGLFWGAPRYVEGTFRNRIKFLLDSNIALYGVHLPLDQHPELGNNAGLAELVGIENPEPFGVYRGRKVGFKGTLAKPLSIDEAVRRVSFMGRPPLGVFPFGKEENRTAAVVSGGGADDAVQAMDEGIDLFITGEAAHHIYHEILEGRLNMIAGGHYSTEVWGVRRVMAKCAEELGLEVEFIDVPTGL